MQTYVGAPHPDRDHWNNNSQFGSYRPNGITTGSLGMFEHWNNPHDRQYSRNLGKNEGIELIYIK